MRVSASFNEVEVLVVAAAGGGGVTAVIVGSGVIVDIAVVVEPKSSSSISSNSISSSSNNSISIRSCHQRLLGLLGLLGSLRLSPNHMIKHLESDLPIQFHQISFKIRIEITILKTLYCIVFILVLFKDGII